LGDGALAALTAAAVLAGDQAGGGHELGGFGVSAQVSDFGDESQSRARGDAAQDLEARGLGNELGGVGGFFDEPVEPSDLVESFDDSRLVLLEDGLGVGLSEVNGSDPGPVALRP